LSYPVEKKISKCVVTSVQKILQSNHQPKNTLTTKRKKKIIKANSQYQLAPIIGEDQLQSENYSSYERSLWGAKIASAH
jgi:hypothetical protein